MPGKCPKNAQTYSGGLETTNVPFSAVVLSSAQAENGRVENPPDRFSPFEGAGFIST
jgi:hypothetical protein